MPASIKNVAGMAFFTSRYLWSGSHSNPGQVLTTVYHSSCQLCLRFVSCKLGSLVLYMRMSASFSQSMSPHLAGALTVPLASIIPRHVDELLLPEEFAMVRSAINADQAAAWIQDADSSAASKSNFGHMSTYQFIIDIGKWANGVIYTCI